LSVRIERALERIVVSRANAVLCVTDQHRNVLRQAYPRLPFNKFVTIPNGYDESEWDALEGESKRGRPVRKDKFVITYAGTFYQKRNPMPLFLALRALCDSGEIDRERVRVDLIGWCNVAGGRCVKEMASEYGLGECVHIVGPLSRREALRRVAHSDLLLLLAEDLTLQVPGKAYEYLRSGRPILALTSEGALSDLLRRTGGAWVVDPNDESRIADAVLQTYRDWEDGISSPRANQAVVAEFDRRLLAGRFASLLERSISEVHS